MPKAGFSSFRPLVRRKPPHRIVIAHGENVRSFTIRPWLVATVGGVTIVFGVLYLAATGYLAFRDDILAASIARQQHMQHAYEDRIAALRADIDRLTSRQLLNQQDVENELDRLGDRQAALDARQDSIANLSQAVRRAGIDAGDQSPDTAGPADQLDGPADDQSDDSQAAPPPPKDPLKTGSIAPVGASATMSLAFAALGSAPSDAPTAEAPEKQIGAIEASLDTLAGDQVAYVDAVAAKVNNRADRIASILKGIGQTVPISHIESADDGVGGPLVGIDANADPAVFRSTVDLISGEIDRYAAVRRLASALPLDRPIVQAAITSGFGPRIDPFLGTVAMHTGVDFRALSGTPARATAGGTVTIAEYTGGYGNMVEIDHGNGITTRYGHLSRIDVTVGQVVSKGDIVGHTGSTGRSTGPHLHYEVRIDGAPIDPLIYIKAGSQISSLL